MTKRVLIIGGYGNFGSFISRALARESNIQVIIAGRSIDKASNLANKIKAVNKTEAIALDINTDISAALKTIKPQIVIHTSGPFQMQGYDVARACVKAGAHYIDLADGRDFVGGITELDTIAKEQSVLVMSGASSVPCLTSALVDYYKDDFKEIESLDYGITTAQKTARGLATTAAILGYTGKAFKTKVDGEQKGIYGWQGLHARQYKKLGWRLLGNCDIPDLDLFPQRYPEIKTIRFYAGLEILFIHLTLWLLSWFVRLRIIKNQHKAAPLLLKISFMFDWFGSDNSAFHMALSGKGKDGADKTINFELTAMSGDGPYIPSMPAIIMAKKLASDEVIETGAFPCMGFITRDEYLNSLSDMDINWTD